MKKLLFIFALCSGYAVAQGTNVTSWSYNETGHQSQYYSADEVTVNNLNDSSEIQEICYNTDSIYIRANILPSFIMGPWPGDPFLADGQNNSYVFPRNPTYPSSTHQLKNVGIQGLLINGVAIYDDGDGKSYKTSTGTNVNNGDGEWDQIAWLAHADEMDSGNGHPDPNNIYHNHFNPIQLCDVVSGSAHSPIIGWAFDGWPIYGPFGYSTAMDNTSPIERMTSSWSLRNITTRTILYDGTDVTDGPAVSGTFPLGTYIQDYGYTASSGDLDYYNGRYCVTPEYPSGTYAYFLNTDASGNASYPNMVGPRYYGTVYLTNFGGTSGQASKMKIGVTCYTPPNPTVTLSVGSTGIYENGAGTTVTATLSETSASNVTVNLSYSGTATSGSDYSSATSIVVTAGSLSASINLTTADNSDREGDKTVIIDISSVTNADEDGTQQQTISLYDEDTKLTATYCGYTLSALTDALYSETVTGATNYRYWIQCSSTGYSTVATRSASDNLFRMSWPVSDPVNYGATYTVKVAAYVNGAWQSYGDACNVTTPATKMQTSSCGVTLTALTDALYSYEVEGATDYRYWVQNTAAGFSKVATRSANDNLFRMSWVSGALYGTTYTVKVAAYVSGSWSAYGTSCNVTTPASLTKLASTSCNVSIPTMATALYSDAVSGATDYRYKVVNTAAGFSKVATRSANDNLFRMSWVTGAQYNTTYTISVAAYVSGSWGDYSTTCTVTTPAAIIAGGEEEISEHQESLGFGEELSLEAFPNPNAGSFTLRASEAATLVLCNELGQIIRTIELNNDNMLQSEILDLPNGAYFVSGIIGDVKLTKKVMVINK